MCFVWISEQTAIFSLYNINWLVFVTETQCVYCAVSTQWLSTIQRSPSLWPVTHHQCQQLALPPQFPYSDNFRHTLDGDAVRWRSSVRCRDGRGCGGNNLLYNVLQSAVNRKFMARVLASSEGEVRNQIAWRTVAIDSSRTRNGNQIAVCWLSGSVGHVTSSQTRFV